MKAENVVYDDGVFEKLLQTSEGDLRRAITYLQSTHQRTSAMGSTRTNGHASKGNPNVISDDDDDDDDEMSNALPGPGSAVTVGIIEEIADVMSPATIDELAFAMQ